MSNDSESHKVYKVKQRANLWGLGHCGMVNSSLVVFRTALLSGIWLISKLMCLQHFQDE